MATQGFERFEALTVEVDGQIATVTMNRPDALNAVNPRLHTELEQVWPLIGDREDLRCIIFTGAGRAFTVGGDIKGMARGDFGGAAGLAQFMPARQLIYRYLSVRQPIIAALNGDCMGIGASLALMSDFVIMAETARIGDPHVRVGMVAGDGGVPIWPLLAGLNQAKEALLLGRLYKADEAKQMGLVGRVVPTADVGSAARKLAEEIVALPPLAVQWTKLSLNKLLRSTVEQAFDASVALEMLTFMSQDHRRAAQGFVDKTKPKFEGN